MSEGPSRWHTTGSLARALAVGGFGVGVALTVGRPAVVVLVGPLLVAGSLALLRKPTREPRALAQLSHVQLYEGQGTRSRLETEDTDDAERILIDAGFAVDIIRVLPEPLTDNIVIRQTPSGEQPAGTTITLYVI